jgi:hypothetical protein
VEFSRNLRKGSSGEDVLYAKQKLVELGYLHAATRLTFGSDTLSAVKRFQTDKGLEADGIIGILTWSALFDLPVESHPEPVVIGDLSGYESLDRFGSTIKNALVAELETVSELRRAICLDALQFAIDPKNPPKYPLSFYIRGGNLYNKDLSLNIMTPARLKSYFAKSAYAPYFDGGRKEMMMEASENSGFTNCGADCSGEIVGLMRKHGVYSSGFDASANTLHASHSTETSNPRAGDWNWKNGHIGLYVGAGYTVEHIGGAYGCQLTKSDRYVWNFVSGKRNKMSKWTAYCKPRKY